METVDVLMKMPKIDGYEYTGEYLAAMPNDFYYCPVHGEICKAECAGMIPRPILRKAEVWKPLTLEKALEIGKSRKKFTFRLALGHLPGHCTTFEDTIDYIDLNPDTRANIRMSYYGWGCTSDIEYLED
jgi:hypothetical protein